MPNRLLFLIAAILAVSLPGDASALSMKQFETICAAGAVECRQNPFLQSYVGGALDLIAMLDEETEYLGQVYCESPKTLFDVPTIIDYMLSHKEAYADKNAMLLLIRYLEEHGGCWH